MTALSVDDSSIFKRGIRPLNTDVHYSLSKPQCTPSDLIGCGLDVLIANNVRLRCVDASMPI